MKKYLKDKRFIISTCIFLIILCIGFVKMSYQNDTFYTIKIGELILDKGIDMKDHLSFHNIAYTYPHWLYDVFIYIMYFLGGLTGVYISTIILFIILILSIYFVNNKLNKNTFIAFLVSLICVVGLTNFVAARAQLLTYILFVWEFYLINKFLETGKKKYGIFIFLISLLICNVHVAVWPFYFILFLPFIGEYVISLLIKVLKLNKENKIVKFLLDRFVIEDNKNYKYLLLIMGLSLLTGLLTPIGDTPYTYIIKTIMGNSQEYIVEHKKVALMSNPFMYVLLIEMLIFTLLSKIKLRDLFLLLGLTLMSLTSNRHLSFLMIFGLFTFGSVLSNIIKKYELSFTDILIKFMSKAYVMIILLVCFSGLSYYIFTTKSKAEFIDKTAYPVELTKYVKENLDIDNIRLYNDYNFGSYLLLNDIPVFIDSRADLYTKQFSGLENDIFDDYMQIYRKGTYEIYFEQYDITHALIYKKQALYSNLNNSKNYVLLKEDDYFALFEKVEIEEENNA